MSSSANRPERSRAHHGSSAHVDTFTRDNLPPHDLWPVLDYSLRPELAYPERLNCAAELLDKAVGKGMGDRPVFRRKMDDWTYGRLLEEANRIAHVLVEDLGVVPGSRVLLRGPNNPIMVASWFAVLKAGGVCVSTMPLLRARELAYVADKARVEVALCDTRLVEECSEASDRTRFLSRLVQFGSGEAGSLEVLARQKGADFSTVDTAADDTAIIAFTSGTTGRSKGTVHFHRDMMAACDCFSPYAVRAQPDDVFCGSPPLAFTFGLGGLVLFPMRIGASSVLLEQASPPNLLQGIQDHRATVCFTAPTAYRAMLGMLGDYDVSSLKICVSAGETLPLATFRAWEEATGLQIIDGIGATELLHIFISAGGEEIRPGSTGKVVPGYRAKIVDDGGNDVPPGTVGRLAVQGPTGCRYLDDVDRQQAYVGNGWNFPGDSFRMDEDGYFWYQSRTDDMIVSSGYSLSGPEVENVILEHPDVAECGVVGVPDQERGQVVKAFVVLREGVEAGPAKAEELQNFVKAEIAPYKYPRRVEFVKSLPRTETGKLQRFRLREQGTG